MRLYNSYNRKGGAASGKGGKGFLLLLFCAAALLLLLLTENRLFFGLSEGLDKTVNENGELSVSEEVFETDSLSGSLEVHFLDVGHGDSTLVLSGEHAMMIDCGDDTRGAGLEEYLRELGVTKLDYLILTHPDKDHIGGAPAILTGFSTEQVFQSDYKKGSETEEDLQQVLQALGIEPLTPAAGTVYRFGEACFTILAPNGIYEESNNSSIALLLRYGENTFLFTGDAEKEAEYDMVENSGKPGLSLEADVYQVGHHGGKSSSKKKFLSAVSPEFAVISCDYQGEKENPDKEVLERLREAGVKVFRTDEQGTVVAVSDGKKIVWSCEPSKSRMAGDAEETN